MTYATELIQQYRIALRYIWNVHFWDDKFFQRADSVLSFNALKLPLFIALVGQRLSPEYDSTSSLFGESFKVVPRSAAAPEFPLHSIIVDLRSEDGGSGHRWTKVTGTFHATDIKMSLLDFFDWEEEYWRDFRYCRVRIHEFEGRAAAVGRDALVEMADVDVLWESSVVMGVPRRIGGQASN